MRTLAKKAFNVKTHRDPSLPPKTAVLSADMYFLLTQKRLVFYMKDPPPKEKTKSPAKARDKKRKAKS